jgi:UDP-sulfoquinovose synthase
MKVFITGIDGYLGWALAQYMTHFGHEVAGVDLMLRREWVAEMGSESAIPIVSREERIAGFEQLFGKKLDFRVGDLCDYEFVTQFLGEFQPDAIVHLGQMPSAPYSMIDQKHSVWTQINNVTSNLNLLWAMREVVPNAHLVKLGTMGEYGQPNIDIAEGFFEVEYRGRKDRLPFPRQAGSWYHQSKVHDSNNTHFACKIWGLKATDIMQGVVFGTQFPGLGDDARLRTRLDYDQCFGTAINRFCVQAVVGHPLTLFGTGTMRRGFLPLRDAMRCLTLAVENSANKGEYRVFNQFAEAYSIDELAVMTQEVSREFGLEVEIKNYDNPRGELEQHYYNPDRQNLLKIGYEPSQDVKSELRIMIGDLMQYKDAIAQHQDVLVPDIRWDGTRRRSNEIPSKETVQ